MVDTVTLQVRQFWVNLKLIPCFLAFIMINVYESNNWLLWLSLDVLLIINYYSICKFQKLDSFIWKHNIVF